MKGVLSTYIEKCSDKECRPSLRVCTCAWGGGVSVDYSCDFVERVV